MEINIFPLELLRNDNYADWSVKMKNNLLAQGLWDIVGTSPKPPKPYDDVVEFEAWREMNDAALHAIQSSCGMDILSQINKISSAKIAWEMLGKMFIKSNGQDKLIQIEDDNSSSNNQDNMETNTLPLELPTATEANQRVESGNSLDNQSRSNSSNISGNGQGKLIQAEAVDPIINEGNSSNSHKPGPEREDIDYAPLLEAVRSGDAEQEHLVEELVSMISEHDLAMQDDFGLTALHETSISGNQRMAECLITKNKCLVSIRDNRNELPVSLAMGCGHKELARYLYSQIPLEDLKAEKGCHGASLLNRCFYHGDLDMALELMKSCPPLAFALDHQSPRVYPLEVLAYNSTDAFESCPRLALALDDQSNISTEALIFESGNYGMVFWKQWIYNHCIHISSLDLARAADQFRLNIQNHGQENNIGSVRADLWRQLASSLLNLLGFKRLYEMKLVRAQFQELLTRMCQESQRNQYDRHIIMLAVFGAIKRGNFEFVYHIVKANPDVLFLAAADDQGRSIFHWVVLYRQHRIFSLIYNLKKKNALLSAIDESDNLILHMAGMVIENTAIDHIRGAALQMQREVQWFKEVERICPLSHKETLNKKGLTAGQLFSRDHQKMREEGERWMKSTATSCTVVGALIITIMFTAAFTIPGGNNQETGLPILVHDELFKLFMVTDSLSLFSSSTSVLMFLGILTSRYAEEDFLRSLPRKMIIGLFALFFSIGTMMIAFSAALLLMLGGKYWIIVPIIGLAGVPIILFVLMQFRLLIDMFVSTYGLGIFNRKMMGWL